MKKNGFKCVAIICAIDSGVFVACYVRVGRSFSNSVILFPIVERRKGASFRFFRLIPVQH